MANRDTKLQIIVDAQNRTGAAFNGVKAGLDEVKKSHQGLSDSLKTVGTAGVVALGGLSLLTKNIIQAGSGFEQTQIAFETMLGSAEQGTKTLAELSQFAARTPFQLGQLEEASKRLLAYGTTADELIPTLKMLGDVTAGVGMDKLPQLILAFGQVRAATKLTGSELRQFSEAGVPLLGTLAQQLGKTEAEIIEMVSAGEVGFPQVQAALASLTGEGGKFFNLMERQSTSLGGLWSNLQDQISLTARSIGEQLIPYLKPLLEQLIAVTLVVGEFVKQHPQLSAFLLMFALGLAALTALLLPILIALPGLVILLGALGTAFALVTAMSAPMLLAIGLVGTAMVLLAKNGYFTKQAWEEVWLGIKIIAANGANAVIGVVESMVNFVISAVNSIIKAVNKAVSAMAKVPGLGSKFKSLSIDEIGAADFGRIDTSSMANSSMKATGGQTVINLSNNTFLDQNSAVIMGDLLLNRLKMSNAL